MNHRVEIMRSNKVKSIDKLFVSEIIGFHYSWKTVYPSTKNKRTSKWNEKSWYNDSCNSNWRIKQPKRTCWSYRWQKESFNLCPKCNDGALGHCSKLPFQSCESNNGRSLMSFRFKGPIFISVVLFSHRKNLWFQSWPLVVWVVVQWPLNDSFQLFDHWNLSSPLRGFKWHFHWFSLVLFAILFAINGAKEQNTSLKRKIYNMTKRSDFNRTRKTLLSRICFHNNWRDNIIYSDDFLTWRF